MSTKNKSDKNFTSVKINEIKDQNRSDLILDLVKSHFNEIEAYRTLRTNISFSLVQKEGAKVIIVTSSVAKEGKSTVSLNLARIMAQANSKVLIIDCDLRKPRLHKFYRTKCIPGVSNVLIGECDVSQIVNKTDEENLSVIYSGTIPPNPAEMLGSDEMKKFIEKLRQQYDYIILDTPPVLPVADALVLSQLADGAIIVALQGYTTHSMLKNSLSKLEFAKAKTLGIVLNGATPEKEKKYNRYSKMYK